MKLTVVFFSFFLLVFFDSYSQFGYYPPKGNVTDEEYRKGKLILENSYSQIINDDYRILAHDYWNIAVAYQIMGQSQDSIFNYLSKAQLKSPTDFCLIVDSYHRLKNGIENTDFYKLFGSSYSYLVAGCKDIDLENHNVNNPNEYAKKHGYDSTIIFELDKIAQRDQKFGLPTYDASLQIKLDSMNINAITSIIAKYGYPGRSMVGAKYESVAWLVIHHSNLQYQEMYLPLIHKTVLSGELSIISLKMLLDRIYMQRIKKQIFGSQIGVDFADDETISEVKAKYNID